MIERIPGNFKRDGALLYLFTETYPNGMEHLNVHIMGVFLDKSIPFFPRVYIMTEGVLLSINRGCEYHKD
ncbi:MAG: hypothetical protein KKE44_20710 [Proteobacteria bacterium]|nr:hypothetical protein [Pseudomonadota bacterium]MBU1585153.1 hypothetical protein [Pseudomonadota bacterium]MBU2454466.1 hypothetical protein [Pseudomonadota bacterium]MBU2629279.1 hypothetical protein [Pseudomonadota bacterium]